MKYLLIEPHPDDIVLSMHYIAMRLARKGEVGILSMFGNDERNSAAYCEEMGYRFFGNLFDTETLRFKQHKLPPHVVKKQKHPYRYQVKVYGKRHSDEVTALVEKLRDGWAGTKGCVVCCLGILHPWHVVTRIAVDEVFSGRRRRYYADCPYQFRVYGQLIVADSGLVMKRKSRKGKEKVNDKLRVFRRCYPTEASLLKFEKPGFHSNPELVLG